MEEPEQPDREQHSASSPDLRCYYHPEREATSQCDSCGDYLCEECTSHWGRKFLCPACHRKARPKLPVNDPRARTVGTSLIILAIASFLLSIVTSVLNGACMVDIFAVIIAALGRSVRKGGRSAMKWSIAFMVLYLLGSLGRLALLLLLWTGLMDMYTTDLTTSDMAIPAANDLVFGAWSVYNGVMLYRILCDSALLRQADVPPRKTNRP